MCKYAFICINYNSYSHLVGLLESIAAAHNASPVDLSIYIVDNSTDRSNHQLLERFIQTTNLTLSVIESKNVGYFPGAALALSKIEESENAYDFISISNVDLRVAPDFFEKVKESKNAWSTGVVAPSIISEKRKDNLNPKILNRPKRSELERTLKIFSKLTLFYVYRLLSDLKSRIRANDAKQRPSQMYAPHGSFIIFTKAYFQHGGSFDYPRFLFGEEVFVGESCLRLKLDIKFNPEIKVYDIDHGSTSLKSLKFLAGEHVKSLQYLLRTYFPEG
jgi:GT2 family glycosyltransferase